MNIDRILASAPIDRMAARVVSSSRATATVGDLTREELALLLERLERKQRLLKRVLNITTKTQHKNLMSAMKIGRRNKPAQGLSRLKANKRAAFEYKRVGEDMYRLIERIRELKRSAQGAA